jgi:hypothetical protein
MTRPKSLVLCLALGFRAMFRPAYWWLALWPVLIGIVIAVLALWWLVPPLVAALGDAGVAWQRTLVAEPVPGAFPPSDTTPFPAPGTLPMPSPDASNDGLLPGWSLPLLVVVLKWLTSPAALAALTWVLGLLAALPLTWIGVLLISGFVVTPVVRADLLAVDYRDLPGEMRGRMLEEWRHAFVLLLRMVGGILMLLPFWFIAPWFAAPAFMLLMSWATASIFLTDALSGLASRGERLELDRKYRPGLLLIGLLVTVLGSLPFLWLVLPIFASVVFTHYGLSRLASARAALAPA